MRHKMLFLRSLRLTTTSCQKKTDQRVAVQVLNIYNSESKRKYSNFGNSTNTQDGYNYSQWGMTAAVAGTLSFTAYAIWQESKSSSLHAAASIEKYQDIVQNLPTYRKSEVAEHYNSDKRIWVSFKRGVYDVTDFVSKHPGGSRIMMAAGGSLEPFWELYPVHQRNDVFEILEKYRIGNLTEEDLLEAQEFIDHFKDEPTRHPCFIQRSKKPFNGETPPFLLTEKFYTPNEIFYVRNHLPVPEVDLKTYQLEIEGIKMKGRSYKLQDIKKQFPKVEISAVIQCGGNRRSEMGVTKPVAGLTWSGGAIGNAKWSGARLRDVLKAAGFTSENYPNPEKIHVQFEGLDSDQSGECYGASIPLSYILDENFEGVLAYEMNDKPLPLDHGFPIRVVLPGIVGARSVKWLSKIIISEEESQAPWQQRDYKVFSPSVTMETVDFSTAPAIMDTPVTSYICSHENGQTVSQGPVKLQGYAYSGGGRNIIRVEISKNRGATWEVATITKQSQLGTRNWAWVLWEANISVNKENKEVWVKAVDSGYNQQAEDYKNIWNYRGLLSTAYHKIIFKIQ